ncbi:unnamed protein product [Peniophora sp. CBMAI 1063]|nr:unnamed protein product [Peniophora sp. CBMAI 1063]
MSTQLRRDLAPDVKKRLLAFGLTGDIEIKLSLAINVKHLVEADLAEAATSSCWRWIRYVYLVSGSPYLPTPYIMYEFFFLE